MNLFSKRFRRQGRGALVASRTRRNETSAFVFANFFFAPPISKEKVAMEFIPSNRLFIHINLLADFSFDEVGAKEKSIKKKSAEMGGAAPPPRKLLKKA